MDAGTTPRPARLARTTGAEALHLPLGTLTSQFGPKATSLQTINPEGVEAFIAREHYVLPVSTDKGVEGIDDPSPPMLPSPGHRGHCPCPTCFEQVDLAFFLGLDLSL